MIPNMTNNMHQLQVQKKMLAEKWSGMEGKLSVGDILEEDIKENTAQLLENYLDLPGTRALLEEQAGQSAMDTGNVGGSQVSQGQFTSAIADPDAFRFRPIELALARRGQANLFAYNACGVQAMNGPVGLAYALRFYYDGTNTEAGFENVGKFQGYSGAPGTSMSPSYAKISSDLATAIDGLGILVKDAVDLVTQTAKVTITVGATTYNAGDDISSEMTSASAWGQALKTYDAEKLGIRVPSQGTAPNDIGTAIPNGQTGQSPYAMRQLRMKFDRKAIEAQDRMLGASFSIQSHFDIQKMQGIDIGKEMVKQMSYEVGAETDRELLWKMKNTAIFGDGGQNGVVVAFDPSTLSSSFLFDKKQAVADKIVSLSNEIHTKVLKGAGNIAIVSPKVSTILQTLKNGSFSGTSNYKKNSTDSLVEVGTLEDTITVYRDPWAYIDSSVDYALVAYKGEGISDCGIIYHPYMMNLVNTATSQEDFGTRIGVLSRYAITDSLLGSGRYYRYIEFVNLNALGV